MRVCAHGNFVRGDTGALARAPTLLLAQMRQNAALIAKLGSSRSSDRIQEALSGGGASGSSTGINGHLAREAFVRQLTDAKAVASGFRPMPRPN